VLSHILDSHIRRHIFHFIVLPNGKPSHTGLLERNLLTLALAPFQV
jgi:hypothetical protein